jgi:hypothetical protein
MTGFVIILAALQLAVPVRCYQTEQAYAMPATDAYYSTDRYIALAPDTCKQVPRTSGRTRAAARSTSAKPTGSDGGPHPDFCGGWLP